MKRKGVLPKIPKCSDAAACSEWKLEGRMLEAAYGFVVVAGLCIAHIHVQFLQADVALQHSELQKQHRKLLREEQQHVLRYEALCDPSRLADVARVADLTEIDVRAQRVAMVPAELREKYLAPTTAAYPQAMLADSGPSLSGLSGKLISLLDTGSAFAATLPDTKF